MRDVPGLSRRFGITVRSKWRTYGVMRDVAMPGRAGLFLCAFLLSACLVTAQQTTLPMQSVDDFVRAGIANNKDLAAVRERVTEAKGLLRQAGVRPPPTLALIGATAQPFGIAGEEEYAAEYSQTIETFGKRGKRISASEFSVGLAEAELQQRSAQLTFEIKAAYAEVLTERRKMKILDDLIELNRQTLRLTEARVKEGDVGALEARLLKVEIGRAEVSRISAQGRLASAELELRRLVGVDQTAPVPDTDFPAPAAIELDALKQKALENRADLKRARLEEGQAAAGIALAKADAKPDVTLSAGYARRNSQFDGLFGLTSTGALSPIRDQVDVLTFGLSIPLRTSRSGAGNVQAATAHTSAARLSREFLETAVPLEVDGAYKRWRASSDALQLLESDILNPSADNLAVIREAYKLGQLRLLDVLNEQRRLVDTQLAYADAQADAARTWAELERAVGGNLP